jgi:DNA-binding GntR family transcriptional regulator
MSTTAMMDSSSELPALQPASLHRRATDALRTAIVEGRLRPGDRLKEVELAEQLGTSRAPVREALRQLEHEGLVASSPYRGTEVLGVSQDEVTEVLVPIRLTLESFAFSKALPLLTDADFETLRKLVARMREAGTRNDLDELAADDVRFHELVIERSGQPHCLQIWRSIEPRVRAYFRRDAPAHQRGDEIAEEHDELLRALQARDERALLKTLARHIQHYYAPADDSAST